MKKIKILSLFLALCVIFTTFTAVSVSAKVFNDVEENSSLSEILNSLTNLNIISGYADNTFRADSNITRAEVCAIFTRIMPERKNSVAMMRMRFNDVSETDWSFDYVNEAAVLKLVSGYEDNTFRPENNITYSELIKIIMSMLYYQPYADENGGYPNGYINAAKSVGITDNIEFENEEKVTRGNMAVMIERMINTPILITSLYDINNENVYDTVSGATYKTVLQNPPESEKFTEKNINMGERNPNISAFKRLKHYMTISETETVLNSKYGLIDYDNGKSITYTSSNGTDVKLYFTIVNKKYSLDRVEIFDGNGESNICEWDAEGNIVLDSEL